MSKERFEIGGKEKHVITVDLDRVMKHIKIEQDGVIVADEFHYSLPGKKFKFDIGSSERHHVEITIGAFRWLFPRSIELKVDGEKVHPLP